MLGIVVSRADTASTHVCEHLLDVADWEQHADDSRPDAEGGGTVYRTDGAELREFEDWHVELEDAAAPFDDPDLLVFASRHSGETEEFLTAHHTGNFGAAEFGGEPGRFARAAPNAHREVVHALDEHAPAGYDTGMECTHHGPTDLDVPSMFVEVGSDEEQWDDPDAARAVARAVLDLRGVEPDAAGENGSRRHLVGFGGGHYAPRFERVVRETDWAVGHIAADWSLDALDEWADTDEAVETALDRAFAASSADFALLEADYPELADRIESLGHRVVGETFVQETTGVPLSLVATLEDTVGTVGDGLRFGEPATDYDGEWTVVDLPADLVAEANGIDADAVRDLVTSETIAFTTEQSGTVVTETVVVPTAGDRDGLVAALADVLRQRYDSVEREEGELVARETTFDPDLARTADIPEGPKFGKLASGEPIELHGEEIGPERFQTERIRRFTL